MDLNCRYYPARPAVLMCYQCATTVCPDCIPIWPDRGMPRCVTCRSEMEPLGISAYVKPFWQCFDSFFKFSWRKGNSLNLSGLGPVPFIFHSAEIINSIGQLFWIFSPKRLNI